MGIAYDDLAVTPPLGADTVEEALNALKAIAGLAIDNIRYVSPVDGSDVTGNGAIGRPFASVGAAMASITDAAPTKRYVIIVTGRCPAEPAAVVLKPNVFIAGVGLFVSRIQAPAWNVDAAWTPAGDFRTGFFNMTVAGPVNFDMDAVSGNEGKLYTFNAWMNDAVTFTAFSIVNQWISQATRHFGLVTVNGGAMTWGSVVAGTVVVNEAPNGTQFVFSTLSCLISDLTITRVAAANTVLLQDGRTETLTGNGAGLNIFATDDNNPRGATLTGGAIITPLSPGACFAGSGVTGGRPPNTRYPIGYNYFDTDLGIPVWNNGVAWVDATGAVV